MQLNKSKSQTRICKICFKEIKNNNLFDIFNNNHLFCNDCLSKLVPIFYHFKEDKIDCLALYKYDELVQSYLYQIKGCYDIELSPIFLSRYYRELSIYFSGYTIVPVPSWKDDDEIREFNHVEEIYKCLKLPFKKCLYKCEKYKQSDQNKDGRKQISNIIKMSHTEDLTKIHILLVDDVYTTGNTIRTCINLLKNAGAKKIKVLLIAKV